MIRPTTPAWVLAATALAGCAAPPTVRTEETGEPAPDTRRAAELNRRGAAAGPAEAEALFRQAIAADSGYAPAYNNLGTVLLRRKRYAEAAEAFDTAARLRPESAEPRFNLGLLHHEIGRHREAMREYELALELDPGHLQAAENCAILYVRLGIQKERTRELLRGALLREERPALRKWMEEQIFRLEAAPAP